MLNVKPLVAISFLAATLIITTLSTTSPLALAAPFKEISGRSGIGNGLSLTCPGGVSTLGDNFLTFKADFSGGSWSGTMTITQLGLSGQITGTKQGTITDVTFKESNSGFVGTTRSSPENYQVTGTETFDNICNGPVPTTFTITGSCSTTAAIIFQAADGESAFYRAPQFQMTCVENS
jgi:hypothetical protein